MYRFGQFNEYPTKMKQSLIENLGNFNQAANEAKTNSSIKQRMKNIQILINYVLLFIISVSLYNKEITNDIKSLIICLCLNSICLLLLKFTQSNTMLYLTQIILTEAYSISLFFISDDIIKEAINFPLIIYRYLYFSSLITIYMFTLLDFDYKLIIISFSSKILILNLITDKLKVIPLYKDGFNIDIFFFGVVYFLTLFSKKRIKGMTETIKQQNYLQENMIKFLSKILDRSINYFLIIYNNHDFVYMNQSCEAFFEDKEVNSKFSSSRLSVLNKIYSYDNNSKERKSLKSILSDCQNTQLEVNDAKELFLYQGEFVYLNKYFFNIIIRKNTYSDHFSPLEIEIYNITKYKETEKQLNEEMKEKQKLLGRLVHEFKTPIIGLSALAKEASEEIKSDDPKEKAKILSSLSEIETISNYIIILITDFIQISKNTTSLSIDIKEVNLNEIGLFCTNIAKTLIMVQQKNISFDFTYDSSLEEFQFFSDETRLKQIFLNFLSNSIKFTNSGFVKLEMTIRMNNQLPYLQIVIKDSGIGMTEDQLNAINDQSFKNLIIERKNNEYGSGLGLNIANQIAQALEMSIQINSKLGEGTTVTIIDFSIKRKNNLLDNLEADQNNIGDETIPFSFSKVDEIYFNPFNLISNEEAYFNEPKSSILIIDDNSLIRNAWINQIKKALTNMNLILQYQIIEGKDGVDMIKEIINDQSNGNRIKLILSDNQMQYIDGSEGIKIIRKLDNLKKISNVPLSFCFTADDSELTKSSLIESGFDNVIKKEITTNQLEEILKDILL